MRSRKLLLTSIFMIPSLGSFVYMAQRQDSIVPEPFGAWSPSPAAIRQELGPPLAQPFDSAAQQARRRVFAQRFKDRYRSHTPQYAVHLNFMNDHCIKLQTPARMEPWNVDKIALAAWEEARANFGHSFDIEVYETYICAPIRKIGEVKTVPGTPERAQAHYDYPAEPLAP